MNKVLIFTRRESWIGISDKIRNRVKWDHSYPNMDNPIMECAPDVFLIYDNIDLDYLFKIFPTDNFYFILIHEHGHKKEDIFLFKNLSCYILSGLHINFTQYYYYPAFKIITDLEDNKLNRIINTIFIMNALIELKKKCIEPNIVDLGASEDYRAIYQVKMFRDDLDMFKNKYQSSLTFNDCFDCQLFLHNIENIIINYH